MILPPVILVSQGKNRRAFCIYLFFQCLLIIGHGLVAILFQLIGQKAFIHHVFGLFFEFGRNHIHVVLDLVGPFFFLVDFLLD